MAARPIVIVSNRGPLSFRRGDDGELVARRGAGGLVSGLAPLVAGTDGELARRGHVRRRPGRGRGPAAPVIEAEGLHARLLELDPDDYRMAYDVVCNATLWFVHHGLFDLARRPRFDHEWSAGLGRLPPGQRGLRRRHRRRRARGRGRAGAGLPPQPAGPDAAPSAGPTCGSCTSRHTPFAGARLLAGAARRGAPRAARGHGRPPRLRLPLGALGRPLRRRRAGRRHRPRPPPSWPRSAPDPDDLAAMAATEACGRGAGRRSRPSWRRSAR